MRNKLIAGFMTGVFLILTGCASGPKFAEFQSELAPVTENNGRIYVYRNSAFGAAIQPAVRLNDEVVGKAKPKGFFVIDRPAGNYVISASTEAKRSLSLALANGEEKYVRLEIKIGLLAGHIKPVLVEPDIGKEEIKKTKYIGEE